MFQVRKSAERGHADHGWLDARHTFSFASYHDRAHMGFRALRVMNEDRVAPGQGFDTHGHRDMEIITYVLDGVLEHKDSLGSGAQLRAGELQHITAGAGIEHSEFNPSATQPVHLYQIWLFPEQRGLPPSYQQQNFDAALRQGRWQLVAAPTSEDGAMLIHQDAKLWLAQLPAGETLRYDFAEGRHGWLQVTRGSVIAAGQTLSAGDGLAISEESNLEVSGLTADGANAEVMLFDLA